MVLTYNYDNSRPGKGKQGLDQVQTESFIPLYLRLSSFSVCKAW